MIESRIDRAARENRCFLVRPLFSSLAFLRWTLFDLHKIWHTHTGSNWLTTCIIFFLKLHLTQDIVLGIRVGWSSREVCAFCFDNFFPRQPSYAESCSIWMIFGTQIVELIVQVHAKFQLLELQFEPRFCHWKQSSSSISCNLCFLVWPLFSSLALLP